MNKTISKKSTKTAGIRIKSGVKAGWLGGNHSVSLATRPSA